MPVPEWQEQRGLVKGVLPFQVWPSDRRGSLRCFSLGRALHLDGVKVKSLGNEGHSPAACLAGRRPGVKPD